MADPLGNGADGIYDRIEFKYNRQGEVTEIKDQNETVHAFDYDMLGRRIHDRVTALGSGVDGAVRRISTSYEVRGMAEKITSWNGETVGSGSVVNEVQFAYNDFGQITARLPSPRWHREHVHDAQSPVRLRQTAVGQHDPADDDHVSRRPRDHVRLRRGRTA